MSLSLIPPNVVDYKIIESQDTKTLEAQISALLKNSYIPYGEMQSITRLDSSGSQTQSFIQVVIKQGMPSAEVLKMIANLAKVQNMSGMTPDQNIQNAVSTMMAQLAKSRT